MQEVLLLEWSGSTTADQPVGSSTSHSDDSADGGVPMDEDDVETDVEISAEALRSGFVLLPMIGALLLGCSTEVSKHVPALDLPPLEAVNALWLCVSSMHMLKLAMPVTWKFSNLPNPSDSRAGLLADVPLQLKAGDSAAEDMMDPTTLR